MKRKPSKSPRGRPPKDPDEIKKVLNFSLTPEAQNLLRQASKKTGQSMSALLEMCIRQHIAKGL